MKRLVATVLTLVMVFSMLSVLSEQVAYAEENSSSAEVQIVFYGTKLDGSHEVYSRNKQNISVIVKDSKEYPNTKIMTVKYSIADVTLEEMAKEGWEFSYSSRLQWVKDATVLVINDTRGNPLTVEPEVTYHLSQDGFHVFEFDLGMVNPATTLRESTIAFYAPFKEVDKKKEDQNKDQNQNQGQDENKDKDQNNDPGNANSGTDTDSQQESAPANDGGVDYFPPVTTTTSTTETVEIEEEEAALGKPEENTTEAVTQSSSESNSETGATETTTAVATVEIEEEEVALGSGEGEQGGNDSGVQGARDSAGGSLPHTGNLPNELFYIVGALLLVGGILIRTVRAK